MFQKPYDGADEEIRQTLERGREKMGPRPAAPTPRTVLVTVAWIGALLLIGWVLISIGLLDPEFCQTANPVSC